MSRSPSASLRCWLATPSPSSSGGDTGAGCWRVTTPGLRFTIFFTAGTLHVKPAVFFIYDFVAAAFSVPVLVYVAYGFGGQIDNVIEYARHTEHGILVAIVIAAIIIGVKLWRRRKRLARLAAAAPDA